MKIILIYMIIMGLLQLYCGFLRVNHDNWVTVGSVPLWNISPSLDVVYTSLPVISARAGRALNNRVTDGHMCYSQVKCHHVLLNTFFFFSGLQNQKAADKKLSFFNSPNICNCSWKCKFCEADDVLNVLLTSERKEDFLLVKLQQWQQQE